MTRGTVVVVFLCSLLSAAIAQTGPSATGPAPGAPAAGNALVVVRVGGTPITEKEVLEAINQLARRQPPTGPESANVPRYKEAVDALVGFVLLKKEAKEKNITVEPSKVDEAWQTLVKRFPSEDQFKRAMLMQGVNEEQVRKSIGDSLLYQKVLEGAMKDVPPPADADMQKYYEDNPQYFQAPEMVHAAHILLKTGPAATPEQKAEIRKKLEAIRAEIEGKKITFAEAAKQSDDKSNADKGGDLGSFPRGQMVKPFEEAAFSTKPGTISGVVETEYGFHLINVIELKPARKLTFEESKQDIRGFLIEKSRHEAAVKHVEELKKGVQIETLVAEDEWVRRHSGN